MVIRPVRDEEYADAMELVWSVFLDCNASGYSNEGVFNFRKFLTDETLYLRYREGEYPMFGFFDDKDEPKGVISLRNGNHISLLFVDREYRNRGIGKRLLDYLCVYCREYQEQVLITVNSSPYAVGFYRKYGFVDTDSEQESDGITYTPMEYVLL